MLGQKYNEKNQRVNGFMPMHGSLMSKNFSLVLCSVTVWWDTKCGTFRFTKTWEMIREKHSCINWWKSIWFPGHIPKHSFISWLAIKNRLLTR